MVICYILGCKSRSERKLQDITYHTFPKDSTNRQLWIRATGRLNWQPTKYTRICSRHFEQSCFRKTAGNMTYLKAFSIPTLHIVEQESDTTRRSSAAEPEEPQSDEAVNLPESEEIIANVYRYLQQEFESLKSSIGDCCDLSPLANILTRTAEATGVSEKTVTASLNKRKRKPSKASRDKTAREKRLKVDLYFDDSDVSPIEEESSDKSGNENPPSDEDHPADEDPPSDEDHPADKSGVGGQRNQEEHEIETLKVELVEEEDEAQCAALKERIRMDGLDPSTHGTSTAADHLVSATFVEMKPEPIDENNLPMAQYVHLYVSPSMRVSVTTPAVGGCPHAVPCVSNEVCEATRSDVTGEPPGNCR